MTNQESNLLINELLKCNCNTCVHFIRDSEKWKQAPFKDKFFGNCAIDGVTLQIDPKDWMDNKNDNCHVHRRTMVNYKMQGFPNDYQFPKSKV